MKLTASVLAFSLFSCSVLIGGNFYQNANNNQNVSKMVYGNRKGAQVTNLLKTNRDLGVVQDNIDLLNFRINRSNNSLEIRQNRKNNLFKDQYKKENRLGSLKGKIIGSIHNVDLLSHPSKLRDAQASNVVIAFQEFKKIKSNIQILQAKLALSTTPKKEKSEIRKKIRKFEQELKEKRKKWNDYVFVRTSINKAAKVNEERTKQLEAEQETSKSNLEKTKQSLESTSASMQRLGERLKINRENLGTFQKHESTLRSELENNAQEIKEI